MINPQPIHLQHQDPPHPMVVHNIPPPPYIVGQPVRNIQTTFVQTVTPANNFMEQQIHNPAYIPNVHGQITEMKHSDSNNCIEQQIHNPAYIPNVHGQITEMKNSDSNNCIEQQTLPTYQMYTVKLLK
jgi:hypothetical protein